MAEKKGTRRIFVSFTKGEIEVGLPECIEARASGLGMKQAEYFKHLAKKDLKWDKRMEGRNV